jgi:cytochrome c oxidase assembly protein subunit 15|tara:strand:+ start:52 stop:477 length:426 start_codon:yes stop_codon:yes gene_type:complete
MDFAGGFEVWRALGVSSDGSAIAFSALTAIHYVHRLTAYVLLLAMVLLGWRLRAMPAWRVTGNVVWCVSAWQLVTGLSNVVLGWPLVAAVAHTGGAAAMVIVFTGLLARVVFDKRARAVEDQTVTPAVSKVATTSSQRSVA